MAEGATQGGADSRAWGSAEVEAWLRGAESRERWLTEATERMLDLAGVGPGARVLDVGAGAGGQTLAAGRDRAPPPRRTRARAGRTRPVRARGAGPVRGGAAAGGLSRGRGGARSGGPRLPLGGDGRGERAGDARRPAGAAGGRERGR